MNRPEGTRPRGWGASREPHEAEDDREWREEAPRRAPQKAPSSLPPVTLAFGLIVLVFGLWTIKRRWRWVSGAMDLNRVSRGARDAASQLAEVSGFPIDGLVNTVMPYDTLFLPMLAGGVLGVASGSIFSAIGGLLLLKSRLASHPGARGLLIGASVFALANACDVWLGHRTITMWAAAMRLATPPLEGVDDRIRTAMTGAYESLAAANTPSLSTYLTDAVLWVLPVFIIAVWGSRHLASPEVEGPLGLR